jgi:hypothetical protein
MHEAVEEIRAYLNSNSPSAPIAFAPSSNSSSGAALQSGRHIGLFQNARHFGFVKKFSI